MRITFNVDETLLTRATKLTGLTVPTAVVREALKALIQRESAQRLAQLGGSQPVLTTARRRRGPNRP